MSAFYTSRRDPRSGQIVETLVAGEPKAAYQSPEQQREAAASRLLAALPTLLNDALVYVERLENALPSLPMGANRLAAEKEIRRFRERAEILSEGRFPMRRVDGLDAAWFDFSHKHVQDAIASGLSFGDDDQLSGVATVQASAPAAFVARLKSTAAQVRRLETDARKQAAANAKDRGVALDLIDKADTCKYVAAYLDGGDVPRNKFIDRYFELFNTLLPLWSEAQAAGKLVEIDHIEALAWSRQ